MKLTNLYNVDLSMVPWLEQSSYSSGAADAPKGELISATTIMKPTRQLILQRHVDAAAEEADITDFVASRMGQTLHDGIEKSWTEGNWQNSLRKLGHPQEVIDSIVINPEPSEVTEDQIPLYLERRGFKEHAGVVITGQLDMIINGSYRDFKTTSTLSFTTDSKDEDYILQGSIYRWLFPELITDETMRIVFLFTDWQGFRAKADPAYPQQRTGFKDFHLMSMKAVEAWLDDKVAEIIDNVGKPQSQMIRCNDKQLWKSPDSYKYYTDPAKARAGGRCTKRFTSKADAMIHLQDKGKGVIDIDRGEVKACKFCSAFSICDQRRAYFNGDGSRPK